jgi:hypothetical protein
MIAGQSGNADENPDGIWGCDAASSTCVALLGPNGTDLPGIYPCFDYQTMADLLDAKGVTWKYYAHGITDSANGIAVYGSGFIWSAFQAIKHIRFGADWNNNVVFPSTQVLTDIGKGQLAQVTWIVPAGSFSDHAGKGLTAEGPDWVASITNAIGASPLWNSTAIFIAWTTGAAGMTTSTRRRSTPWASASGSPSSSLPLRPPRLHLPPAARVQRISPLHRRGLQPAQPRPARCHRRRFRRLLRLHPDPGALPPISVTFNADYFKSKIDHTPPDED